MPRQCDFLADRALEARLGGVRDHFAGVEHSPRQSQMPREGMTVVIAGRPNAVLAEPSGIPPSALGIRPSVVVIGPEGGFSPDEVAAVSYTHLTLPTIYSV